MGVGEESQTDAGGRIRKAGGAAQGVTSTRFWRTLRGEERTQKGEGRRIEREDRWGEGGVKKGRWGRRKGTSVPEKGGDRVRAGINRSHEAGGRTSSIKFANGGFLPRSKDE